MHQFGLKRENLWGHKKRFEYFLSEIKRYGSAAGKDCSQVKILDVGCGNGSLVTLPLAERGYLVTGVDMSRESIAAAIQCSPFPHTNFFCSDITTLDFEERFDVVICSEVLEHLSDPARCIEVVYRALLPGGMALFTTPNGYGPFEVENKILKTLHLMEILVFLKQRLWTRFTRKSNTINLESALSCTDNRQSGHIQFFRLKRVRGLIEQTGFSIERFCKSSVLGGHLSNKLIGGFPVLLDWNCRLADVVPSFAASGWYFTARKGGEGLSPHA